jgi:hypothetical protein
MGHPVDTLAGCNACIFRINQLFNSYFKVLLTRCGMWPNLRTFKHFLVPDRKNGINLIPSRYHWGQLDAKLNVLDINFPVR